MARQLGGFETPLSRRRLLQNAVAGGAVLTIGPLLSACGSGDEASSEAPARPVNNVLKGAEVVALFSTLDLDYYNSWNTGAKRAVEALGGKYRFAVNEQNPAKEVSQFEQAIQSGAKIFVVTAPDPSNITKIAEIAAENKVHFTNTWESPPWTGPLNASDYYVTYFIPDNFAAAGASCTSLFEKMGGKGNFVQITGFPGGTPDWQRTAGVEEVMKKFPGIKRIESGVGKWAQEDSRKVMAGIIRKVGKENVQGVFGQNDDCAIGAINALTEADLTDVPVVGIDGSDLGTKFIKAGKLHATFSTFPDWTAGFNVVRAVDAAMGFKPTASERQMWTNGTLITKENVDAYLKYINGPDPYDWVRMSRTAHPDDWDPQNAVEPIDFDRMWGNQPKPSGYKMPPELAAAQEKEFEEITQLYASQYKKKIFGA